MKVLALLTLLTGCVNPGTPADEVVLPADAAASALITKANGEVDDVAIDFQVGIPPSTYDAATMELTDGGDAGAEAIGKTLDDAVSALGRFQDKDVKIKALADDLKALKDRLGKLSPDQRWLAKEAAERALQLGQGLDGGTAPVPDVPEAPENPDPPEPAAAARAPAPGSAP
jgi:hypothetical protein